MNIFRKQYSGEAHTRKILRYGAFAAPIALVVYGLIVSTGVLPVSPAGLVPTTDTIIVLSISWLLLGAMTFLTEQPGKWLIGALELSAYLALAVAQTWLVSGLNSPFAAFWVLLLAASYMLFGRNGLRISVLVFVLTLAVDTLYIGQAEPAWATQSMLTAVAVLVSSLVLVNAYASQQTSHKDLIASKAREERERGRILTLINNITDAVFSTNDQGIIKVYNAASLNLLDTNERIDGKFIGDLMYLEDEEGKPVDIFEELSKNNTIRQRDDLIMRLSDGDLLRIEATLAPVQNNSGVSTTPSSYVLILRDITRMKSLEEERDEFISVVSHELRTPVTIAEGSLSNALILAERGLADKTTDSIDEAHKQVLFLAKMINDLSTLSRAERGISDASEVIDVSAFANQLHSEYAPQASAKGLAFNLDVIGKPGTVTVSPLYLQELLQNFITNAIKYTPEGSVTLKIEKVAKNIVFSVTDTGIGIGKADQKKIFSRFYRAEDYRTRETNGTGLGLYVATKLARKLGCDIDVTSRLNHGSTFSFAIPASKKVPKK